MYALPNSPAVQQFVGTIRLTNSESPIKRIGRFAFIALGTMSLVSLGTELVVFPYLLLLKNAYFLTYNNYYTSLLVKVNLFAHHTGFFANLYAIPLNHPVLMLGSS